MKSLILSLFLFISFYSYSQTISEKWNSVYNRYDYTDGNGNLVGYKGYNSITQSWEYTSLNTPDPRVAQYNEPQSPIDLQLLDRALAANQARYEKNQALKQAKYNEGFRKVKRVVDYYRAELANLLDRSFYIRFEKEVVDELQKANYDFSRVDADDIIRWITKSYNVIMNIEN
jgi:hypothetical protein